MKFKIDNRLVEDYNLSNTELLELVRSENTTKEEKEFLTSMVMNRFSYNLCPKAGENEDDVFVRFFSNFVNGKLISTKHVAERMGNEHRYLQGEMFKVCMAYIKKLSEMYEKGYYDGRNSYACETSNKIINSLNEMDWSY